VGDSGAWVVLEPELEEVLVVLVVLLLGFLAIVIVELKSLVSGCDHVEGIVVPLLVNVESVADDVVVT
jgi:hypothetical protein